MSVVRHVACSFFGLCLAALAINPHAAEAGNVGDPVSEALIEGDFARACLAAPEGAENGSVARQYLLGTCFEDGIGQPQDFHKAAEWYRKAMEQGLTDAKANLGWLFARGLVPGHAEEGLQMVREGAEDGHPLAELFLARLLADRGGPIEQTLRWLHRSAAGGNFRAALDLADLYRRRDPAQVEGWRQEAERLRTACAGTAVMDACAPRDPLRQKAIVAGYNRAWRILSGQENGTVAETIPLIEAAAHARYKEAEAQLGAMYMTGTGLPKDLTEAAYWLRRAALHGSADGKKYLDQVLAEAAKGP